MTTKTSTNPPSRHARHHLQSQVKRNARTQTLNHHTQLLVAVAVWRSQPVAEDIKLEPYITSHTKNHLAVSAVNNL